MAIEDIADVSIGQGARAVSRRGYGTPLVLSAHALNTDRFRRYTSTAALVSDGFATTSPTYKMLTRLFSQTPRPREVIVGRLDSYPTLRYAVTPVLANSKVYSLKINETTTVSYTSDASATLAEIHSGLKTAIDALALPLTVSDQTTYMRIISNTAGAFVAVESLDVNNLRVSMDHADPGVVADLELIKAANDDWYAVLSPFNSRTMSLAIANWVEANDKFFVAQSNESTIVTGAYDVSGAADLASEMRRLSLFRTALVYHPDPAAFAGAAWAGACLPLDAGSETWKFKTLAGVAITLGPREAAAYDAFDAADGAAFAPTMTTRNTIRTMSQVPMRRV